MEDAREDPTTFTAQSLPSDPRLLATVTNAYLGTRVYRETLHVSGVYNGAGGGAHRAILPNPLNVKMEAPAGTGEQAAEAFALDTNTGSCTGWPLPASACFSGLSLLPPSGWPPGSCAAMASKTEQRGWRMCPPYCGEKPPET